MQLLAYFKETIDKVNYNNLNEIKEISEMSLFVRHYRDDCDVVDIQLDWCIDHFSTFLKYILTLGQLFFLNIYLFLLDNSDKSQ